MTATLPPYASRLIRDPALDLWVLTGDGAWDRAKSDTWCPGQKIVLPYGEDIGRYRWPAGGRYCLLVSLGDPEPRPRLHNLSIALIQAGARCVNWCGALGLYPSPLYRPKAP